MRYPFLDMSTDVEGDILGQFRTVGYYEINNFPGCNQLAVSNHSCIYPEFRGKGLGKALSLEKIQVMKNEGYDYAIATVVGSNERQLKIMENNGWSYLDNFFNRESGNTVNIFGRRISE